MKKFTFVAVLALLAAASTGSSNTCQACSVPVYRYALERWAPDNFEAVVFRRGALSGEPAAALAALRAAAEETGEGGQPKANFTVAEVDLDAPNHDASLAKAAGVTGATRLPHLAVFYPAVSDFDAFYQTEVEGEQAPSEPLKTLAWSAPLDAAATAALKDSPARREVARRLLKGESGVWVFVDSGNRELDDQTFARLEKILKEQSASIELPDPLEEPPVLAPDYDVVASLDAVPLKVAFSALRLSRQDPAEAAFLAMLANSEPDLRDFAGQPMAFPVFGRGRALYAIVGLGINEENVGEACAFLCGPCSCEVKSLNPGTDILMAVDWDALVVNQIQLDVALPPLSRVVLEEGEANAAAKPAAAAQEPLPALVADSTSRLKYVILVFLLVCGIGIVGAGIALQKRGKP